MAKTWTVTNFYITTLSVENGTAIAWWKFNTGGTTDRFDVWWYYYSKSQKWWVIAGNSTTAVNSGTNGWFQNVFTAPNDPDAVKLKCWVKPIPQTNDKGKYKWSAAGVYSKPITSPRVTAAEAEKLAKPDAPTGSGTMSGGKPVLTISNAATYANRTRVLRSVNGGTYTVYKTFAKSVTSWTDTGVSAGNRYRYKLKAVLSNGTESDPSDVIGPFDTKPSAGKNLKGQSLSSTSVKVTWTNTGSTGTWYEVQWSDLSNAWKDNIVDAIESSGQVTSTGTVYTVSGLETGKRWYFRVKRGNDAGSTWVKVSGNTLTVNVLLGTTPAAPSVFTTPASAGTDSTITLRWTHNSEDESEQSAYEVRLKRIVNGSVASTQTISGSDSTSVISLAINTVTGISDGDILRWSVRTKGVVASWSPWSAEQDVSVWEPPTVGIALYDSEGNELETDDDGYVLASFPFKVTVVTTLSPNTAQTVVREWAHITSNDTYETVGRDGSDQWVYAGEQLWRSDEGETVVNAFDLLLTEGGSYTVGGGCVTSAGIKVEAETVILTVDTGSEQPPQPFAEFDFDDEELTMTVWPWCYEYGEGSPSDEEGTLVQGVVLSVYRVNFDGSTTLIGEGLPNDGEQFVRDPHPSFGTCAYRIMASDPTTGAQVATEGVADTPHDGIVIQWDGSWMEEWTDGVDGERYVSRRVDIDSNVTVSEKYSPDVKLQEYAGRSHPVAYHGTQLGQTGSWAGVIIDEFDDDKLEQLRQLSVYHDDCYVREPSGTGYWAVVKVSISHPRRSAAVSVSLDVTRVDHEGA